MRTCVVLYNNFCLNKLPPVHIEIPHNNEIPDIIKSNKSYAQQIQINKMVAYP